MQKTRYGFSDLVIYVEQLDEEFWISPYHLRLRAPFSFKFRFEKHNFIAGTHPEQELDRALSSVSKYRL